MMYPHFPGNPYPYPYMPQQSMMYPMGMMGMKPSLLQSMKYSLNQLSMSSVSYTHLDVYKRQELMSLNIKNSTFLL